MKVESLQSPELRPEIAESLVTNPLDNPRKTTTALGTKIVATDQGFEYRDSNGVDKDRNEDNVIDYPYAGALLDGMGGYDHGDIASVLGARAYAVGLFEGKDFRQIQQEASDSLRAAGLTQDGFCVLAWRIIDGVLHRGYIGNVRMIVIRDNAVFNETIPEQEDHDHKLVDAVTGREPKHTTIPKPIKLKAGDRIIGYTDGIGENFSPEQILKMTQDRSAEEAFQILAKATEAKMTHGLPEDIADRILGKPTEEALQIITIVAAEGIHPKGEGDNRTLLIYDIETLS